MSAASARRVWVGVVVLMLATCIGTQAVLLAYATGDPSFAVERDYESKAARWDDVARQRAADAALGWSADAVLVAPARRGEPARLEIRLADARGDASADADVTFEACAIARAADVATGSASRSSDGAYVAALPRARAGLWEVRVVATRGAERFTARLRRVLTPPGGN